VWLDFDGVYKNSDMWLNGAYLGHFISGFAKPLHSTPPTHPLAHLFALVPDHQIAHVRTRPTHPPPYENTHPPCNRTSSLITHAASTLASQSLTPSPIHLFLPLYYSRDLHSFFARYVSFRYYLHNVTMPNSTTPVLNYGSPNVLSVLVDALTEQEGMRP
jgi:hypothetical protein